MSETKKPKSKEVENKKDISQNSIKQENEVKTKSNIEKELGTITYRIRRRNK